MLSSSRRARQNTRCLERVLPWQPPTLLRLMPPVRTVRKSRRKKRQAAPQGKAEGREEGKQKEAVQRDHAEAKEEIARRVVIVAAANVMPPKGPTWMLEAWNSLSKCTMPTQAPSMLSWNVLSCSVVRRRSHR